MLFKSLVLASTASATCLHGIHKRATGDVEISNFGYTALNGPMNWASLGPENEACKTGKNQSPINIGEYTLRIPSLFSPQHNFLAALSISYDVGDGPQLKIGKAR